MGDNIGDCLFIVRLGNLVAKIKEVKDMTKQELFEADRCFDWVCERIRIDGVSHKSILFGSTLENWIKVMNGEKGATKIVSAGKTPNGNYERVQL